ncbi:EAL domain-containing protein [Arthrobacter sp. 260]|uniref:putative bifunctional diguanylate cyclase/phosphodiesterase n=1 Tax=Arthrobacter sp. 260 TaxID=2735314 RepID=UPI0014913A53|nr:EAL domain-containing protein [Arthrobacter sp. 260]NOJ59938.1 EAL domain-containing protein [Arthrobacter sp. 260]
MALKWGPRFKGEGLPESLFARAHAAMSEVSLITDANQRILHISDSFTAITGHSAADVIGRNCSMLQGPGSDPETKSAMRAALAAGEPFRGEILNYRKDGSAFWNDLSITPLCNAAGKVTHFVSVQRDINTRMALHEQLRFQALHDPVTGLPNRVALAERLSEIFTGGNHADVTAAVGMIDLDDFRSVNNAFGHEAGDQLLKEWALRMQANLRDGDFLGRMGGDEFILVVQDIDRASAAAVLADILDVLHASVERPFLASGRSVKVGMSMGLALFPREGCDMASLLRRADDALYQSKKTKNNRARWWTLAAADPLVGEGSNLTYLRGGGAVPRPDADVIDTYRRQLRGGGLEAHVQPVIDLRDGTVHLFETLARLRMPDGRLIAPGEFLPYLTEVELDELFSRMVDQALGWVAAWQREGLNAKVSVNLPPSTLLNPECLELVRSALQRHGVSADRLGLELLETQTLEWEVQRDALDQLVALGVGLAMDDLGAGYSSLKRLSALPFNAIKLDRELLSEIRRKPVETLSMIASLIQMGRDFGMDVAIEGLEDLGIAEAAVVLGSPLGQGYYITRPFPAVEAVQWAKGFTLDINPAVPRTYLGGLAYHWQFARLGAPHPRPLEECPLTGLLDDSPANDDVMRWHAQQHDTDANHPAAGRLLVDWLVYQIRRKVADIPGAFTPV